MEGGDEIALGDLVDAFGISGGLASGDIDSDDLSAGGFVAELFLAEHVQDGPANAGGVDDEGRRRAVPPVFGEEGQCVGGGGDF